MSLLHVGTVVSRAQVVTLVTVGVVGKIFEKLLLSIEGLLVCRFFVGTSPRSDVAHTKFSLGSTCKNSVHL